MTRGAWFRFIIVLFLLAGCAALALNQTPTLGLDLRGGTSITLETKDSPSGVEANAENTDAAASVLTGRIDALGLSEPNVVRSGSNRIIVELPGVQDSEEAAEQLGRTAQLTVHAVSGVVPEGPEAEPSVEGNEVFESDWGDVIEIEPSALEGQDISGATSGVDTEGGAGWVVNVDFSGAGSNKFADLSRTAACEQGNANRIAIKLDGQIISSPTVNVPCGSDIRGGTQISGSFTPDEAKELAALIEGGSLPLPVEIIEVRELGPSLGEAAIEASIEASIIGVVLTGLFILFVYRFVGLMATIALASYGLLSYAMVIGLGSTLTLPGLAGFVLAIGLAIDANVLVFERAREEYAAAPSMGLKRALIIGFNKAWSAIIDSNVTTLLAALLLFILGSGPIKGFGVTLAIGVVASMISALIIARVLSELGVSTKFVSKRPRVSGIGGIGRVREWLDRKQPQLVQRRGLVLGLSAATCALAVLGIFVNGLNLGVEFTGGRVLEYSTTQKVTADETREALAEEGFEDFTVQETSGDKISIRTGDLSNEEAQQIEDAMAEIGDGATQERDEQVGASFGQELRDKAIIAFALAFLAQWLYLGIRYKWTFGLAAIVAMFHDVIIVVGLFAWLGKPIDSIFLAAAMTIIGLSVNDTVVVYDRVRERWQSSKPDDDFLDQANRAAVETLPRTFNTGLSTMFILAALAILGGDSLENFSIALLVGLGVGMYSGIFTAIPLVSYMQAKWPMSRERKAPKDWTSDDSGAVV